MSIEERAAESIFSSLRRDYQFYFSRLLNRVMVEPDVIQIMLTSRCNIQCKICDVWKERFTCELNTEEVKSLIDQAIDLGIKTIYFTGGEALLRKDIFELVDYASRPGIIVTLNTNGSLITDELAKAIVSSRLSNITFSIDSATQELHDSIRGNAVFGKAVQAIERINYYKKQLGRDSINSEKRLDVGIVCVIIKPNISELPEVVQLAEKLKCCYVAFQPLVFNGNLLENIDFKSDFWLEDSDITKLEQIFKELESLKKEKITKGLHVDFMPEKTIKHFKRERWVNTCFAGFSRIFVNPQGDISFVCFEPFGNIKQTALRDAWHSQKAYLLREKIKECKVNCTQFCSERPESEDIFHIHEQISDIANQIINKEQFFLQGIVKEIECVDEALRESTNFRQAIKETKEIMGLVKNKRENNDIRS